MEDQKMLCLISKKQFVDRVALAICGQPRISIEKIDYEVWEFKSNPSYYDEILKITYTGGAIAIRSVGGDSPSAIFREIANMIDGGYYKEVQAYQEMLESNSFTQIL